MMTAPRDTGDRDAPPDDGASAHGHGSFFGRRKGHKLRIHQADLIDNLLPHLALDIAAPAPARLADLFDGDIEDVRLEIGFGGGEHLIAEAQAFPNIGFIGCEPYVNGMAKILTQIEAHNIGNIRLYAGDAAELLAWAPQRSLARIDLIHPDPWPKRRHWKRRFVQDATVNAMARNLVKAGNAIRVWNRTAKSIEGEIVVMAAKGFAHELIKNALNLAVARVLPNTLGLGVEMTVQFTDRSILEPDIVVFERKDLLKSEANFSQVHSGGILLAIEVAVSSLNYDRKVKSLLYASFGVREFWVIDANERVLAVDVCEEELAKRREAWTPPAALPSSARSPSAAPATADCIPTRTATSPRWPATAPSARPAKRSARSSPPATSRTA
jgi:tRNA (guanine-N7-)-methyltransferase